MLSRIETYTTKQNLILWRILKAEGFTSKVCQDRTKQLMLMKIIARKICGSRNLKNNSPLTSMLVLVLWRGSLHDGLLKVIIEMRHFQTRVATRSTGSWKIRKIAFITSHFDKSITWKDYAPKETIIEPCFPTLLFVNRFYLTWNLALWIGRGQSRWSTCLTLAPR